MNSAGKKNELVLNENERLCSLMIFYDEDKSQVGGVLNFLKRIGYDETKMSQKFVELAQRQLVERERQKRNNPLCPFIKSYGKCMEISQRRCEYRHLPSEHADQLGF